MGLALVLLTISLALYGFNVILITVVFQLYFQIFNCKYIEIPLVIFILILNPVTLYFFILAFL